MQLAVLKEPMSRNIQPPAPALPGPAAAACFHRADILYALEWAATAPGIGGWNVLLDDDSRTTLVSVVPPGAQHPAFFMTLINAEVSLVWRRDPADPATAAEVARFASLREAVRALCELSELQTQQVNEAMEALYPRSLRTS